MIFGTVGTCRPPCWFSTRFLTVSHSHILRCDSTPSDCFHGNLHNDTLVGTGIHYQVKMYFCVNNGCNFINNSSLTPPLSPSLYVYLSLLHLPFLFLSLSFCCYLCLLHSPHILLDLTPSLSTYPNQCFSCALHFLSQVGVQLLQKSKVKEIVVEDFSDPAASAEGSFLSLYKYEGAKGSDKKSSPKPKLTVWKYGQPFFYSSILLHCQMIFLPHNALSFLSSQDEASSSSWEEGAIFAEAQNIARRLMDTPANRMDPTMFLHSVSDFLYDVPPPPGVEHKLRIFPRLVEPFACASLEAS